MREKEDLCNTTINIFFKKIQNRTQEYRNKILNRKIKVELMSQKFCLI